MHLNQENIFCTPIWGFIFNHEKYQSIDYVQYICEMSQSISSMKKSNFGGWQSCDNLHTHGIFREFSVNLLNLARGVMKEYTNKEIEIQSMWANVNDKYNYNWHHTHEGELSGVFYLQVPKDSGRLILVNPTVRSNLRVVSNNNYVIQPQKLACILFPAWLEHYVEPNMSDELRISISFNIGIVKS